MAATRDRSDSLAGLLSSSSALSSLSTLESAEHEANGNTSTDILLQRALRRLESFEQDQNRMLSHPSDLPRPKSKKSGRVDPHKLVKAMLECAPSEHGRRYVAAAISSCDDTNTLVDLSNTWLRYLLLPFKGNRTPLGFPPSDAAYHQETAHNLDVDPHPENRDSNMVTLVRLREGYRCLLTEVYLRGAAPPNENTASLQVSHIIKCAIGVFDPNRDKGSLATWDILRHYIGWDAERTQHVIEKLDTAVNGMLLEFNYHNTWDDFAWTLKPVFEAGGTVIADTYDIEVIRPPDFPSHIVKPSGLPINRRIVFKDHGMESAVKEHMPEDDTKFLTQSRPMPDPELIALHQALCWVLHLSGAAEVIDSILRDVEEAGVQVPSEKIRTTDELDVLLSSLSLYSLERVF